MKPIDLSIIVAMTPCGIIGNKGELPWHLPSDLAHFKKITTEAGVVIMGRKTYESILKRNGKPLPGRKHIVLTKNPTKSEYESVCFVGSVEEACDRVDSYGGRACVIGGAEIYKLFLSNSYTTKIYLTLVYTSISGDTYFPIPESGLSTEWKHEECRENMQSQTDEHQISFFVYNRR